MADQLKDVKRNSPNLRSRRSFRFSLRALLLTVTVIAVWLGVHVYCTNEQRNSVGGIQEFGGWVYYDFELAGDKLIPNAQSSVPTWLLDVLGIDFFHDAVQVNLNTAQVNGVRHENNNQSDVALTYLSGLPKVRLLFGEGKQFSDSGLQYVGKLERLEKLYMWDAEDVGDIGISHLKDLDRLKYLHCSNARMTDESLRALSGLPALEGLALQGNGFTDKGLQHVKGMRQLESLWIGTGDTKITDAGLVMLHEMQQLKELEIQESPISHDGLEKLQQALPKLSVVRKLTETSTQPPAFTEDDGDRPTPRFLAWDHEMARQAGKLDPANYWFPNGAIVSEETDVAPLERVRGWQVGDSERQLHLFISAIEAMQDPYGRLDVCGADGEPLPGMTDASPRSTRNASRNGEPGWMLFQIRVSSDDELPKQGLIRLRYATGPWETAGTFPTDAESHWIDKSTTILLTGARPDQKSFVVVAFDNSVVDRSVPDYQYAVHAETDDGQWQKSSGRTEWYRPLRGTAYQFRQTLASIKLFKLVRRRIESVEFQSISFQPGVITEPSFQK